MKSPERMGGAPEQYDKAKWRELQQGSGEAFAIIEGKKMGVPQEELDRFAQGVIAKETKNHNYGFVYRFMKNMGIGTSEELKIAGERAYQFFIDDREFGSAMGIAEDLYGKDSKQWRRANAANKAEWKKTEARERKREETEDERREL